MLKNLLIKQILLIIILIIYSKQKIIKSGTTFQLQCPFQIKNIPNIRIYALVLNNAQKNMEIIIKENYQVSTSQEKDNMSIEREKFSSSNTTISLQQSQQVSNKNNQKWSNIQPKCILNKNNKVCLFDGFISSLRFECSSSGSVSLLLIQPVTVQQISDDDPLRTQAISPELLDGEKGVAIFKPDNNFQKQKLNQEDIFLSNCIQSIGYFQQDILLGIKGGMGVQVVVVNQGMTGFWVFKKIERVLGKDKEIEFKMIKAYSLAYQSLVFEVMEQKLVPSQTENNYHGFKIYIKSQNRELLQTASLTIRTTFKVNNPLIIKQEYLNRTIQINLKKMLDNIPIILVFFFSQHLIYRVSFQTNFNIHYDVMFIQENKIPGIQQNQYLYYCYQKLTNYQMVVKAIVHKSIATQSTKILKIVSEGIKEISGQYKYSAVTEYTVPKFVVKDEILPSVIANQKPYSELQLHITVQAQSINQKPQKKQSQQQDNTQDLCFKLLLQPPLLPVTISIGAEIEQYIYKNEVKKYQVLRERMLQIKSKKLLVKYQNCSVFASYNQSCQDVSCSQKIYGQQIDVKPLDLYLFIILCTNSSKNISIMKLQISENEQALKLIGGKVIEGSLPESDTYIYESDGNQEIQIICNSQIQAILLLINVQKNQFPNKTFFDFQSNQGYIRIPALKSTKTIYIRLFKMTTQQYTSYSIYKLLYSLVVVSKPQKIGLIQGKPLNHPIYKNGQKEYLLQHTCMDNLQQQSLYLKIKSRNHLSVNINNRINIKNNPNLYIQVRSNNQNKILYTQNITDEDDIELTNFFINKQKNKNTIKQNIDEIKKQNICKVILQIKSLVLETLYIGIMFFKEKQRYQILAGQFIVDHLLAHHGLMLYCLVDPSRPTNIYAYSINQQIVMKSSLVSVRDLQQIPHTLQTRSHPSEQDKYLQNNKIIEQRELSIPSYAHYTYYQSVAEITGQKTANISVVLITIYKTESRSSFEKKNIFIICTQNETILMQGNRLYYKLKNEQKHNFIYPLSQVLIIQKNQKLYEKQIILQTTKLDGIFNVQVKLQYYSQVIFKFQGDKNSNSIINSNKFIKYHIINQQEPILIIKTQNIKKILKDAIHKNILMSNVGNNNNSYIKYPTNLQQISFANLRLSFQVICHKLKNKSCTFLTSIQTSQSDIRQLTPGVPQIFRINKHSSVIFIYNNNLHDRQFKFKVNRKQGLPNYKICSYRPRTTYLHPKSIKSINYSDPSNNKQNQDKCLMELQTPVDQYLMIQQNIFNTDSKMVVGRTHQLIINQYNQQYCINCTYYLGLYSGYEVVEGSIFVMSANQPTLLEQASSITTIVYRGQPDRYMISNWQSLMGIIYQIQGTVQVNVYYLDDGNKKINAQKSQYKQYSNRTSNEYQHINIGKISSIITINLQNISNINDGQNNKQSVNQRKFYIDILPRNNSPSALYTLIVMSKDQHIINMLDGVPYQMKYNDKNIGIINPVIKYRYRCETQGVVTISTRDFDSIDIQIKCTDELSTQNENTQNKQQHKVNTGDEMELDNLLKTRKQYKMSNRLDINMNHKICSKYQIIIMAKTPVVSYTILVSSNDIITLPMHKEIPGILKYQTKLQQIYQVSVNQKTQVRCTLKFCQGGDGRVMIFNSKNQLFRQMYQNENQINQESSFLIIRYIAKPGLFYIKVQFKGKGGVLQYTIHVQRVNINENEYQPSLELNAPIKIYKNINTINYRVIRIQNNFTEYQIQFYPIVQNLDIYEIQYYVVETTQLKLLKKTVNCNGQYFVEFVNHHEQIRQTKVSVQKNRNNQILSNQKQQKQNSNIQQNNQDNQQQQNLIDNQQNKISFRYSTNSPYTYITIIPIVYNKNTHEYYHLFIPKYHEVQLKNGQIFAKLTFILGQIASRIQIFVDIHGSEKIILVIVIVLICLCMMGLILFGIWLGANYMIKTKTVVVFKQLQQSEMKQQNDQFLQHHNQDAALVIETNVNSEQRIMENKNLYQNNIWSTNQYRSTSQKQTVCDYSDKENKLQQGIYQNNNAQQFINESRESKQLQLHQNNIQIMEKE